MFAYLNKMLETLENNEYITIHFDNSESIRVNTGIIYDFDADVTSAEYVTSDSLGTHRKEYVFDIEKVSYIERNVIART